MSAGHHARPAGRIGEVTATAAGGEPFTRMKAPRRSQARESGDYRPDTGAHGTIRPVDCGWSKPDSTQICRSRAITVTNGEHTNMTAQTTDDLHARRDQMSTQLNALQSQHADIAHDLRLAEEDWRAVHAAGQNAARLAERRRHREIGLRETSWLIEQIRGWLADTDTEIRRRASHEALDRNSKHLAADL